MRRRIGCGWEGGIESVQKVQDSMEDMVYGGVDRAWDMVYDRVYDGVWNGVSNKAENKNSLKKREKRFPEQTKEK